MKKQELILPKDLKLSFLVDQTSSEVFAAVTNVRGWWSQGIAGGTREEGEEFIYKHGDVHYSKHRLTEVIPGKKVVWLTTDSRVNFTDGEWTGTTIVFDISEKGGKTILTFTHIGLTPLLQCYGGCSGAWEFYVRESLLGLIVTGEGQPDPA